MKLRSITFLFSLLMTFVAFSQKPEPISFDDPLVKVFLPEKSKSTGRAVVICPGGGYTHLAGGYEGFDWAPFFNDRGIALIELRYKMPEGNPDIPMNELKSTIKMVRENAAQWNIDPKQVGVMGSSAGGHLVSLIATESEDTTALPDFQILCYPVISMDKAITHMGSHDKLIGKDASKELEEKFSSEKRVNKLTPRAFIAFSDDDKAVPPHNGTFYYTALHNLGIPASLHIYPTGGHGWGCKDWKYKAQMQADLSAWLESF